MWKHILSAILCAAFVQGCVHTKPKRLDLTFHNSTPDKITDARVAFLNHHVDFGVVGAGFGKTYMHYERPLAPEAVVRWSDIEGKWHERNVSIISIIETKASGNLTFEIKGEQVDVRLESFPR